MLCTAAEILSAKRSEISFPLLVLRFHSVNASTSLQVIEYLAEMPAETPVAFGFHPNAEIGFKLREGDAFCNSLILMQARHSALPHQSVHETSQHRLLVPCLCCEFVCALAAAPDIKPRV